MNSQPSAPPQMSGRTVGINPYLRCPLPPFNAGPDTLRQYNENGKIPTRRVIPLPIQTQVNAGSSSSTSTTIIQQGGGSSSSGASLTPGSAQVQVPALSPGQTFIATVVAAKSFQLLQVSCNNPLEIRLYGDAITQGSDIVRATDDAVPFEVVPGIITDVVFDTSPFIWNWQNRLAANADSPQTSNLYITVVNPSTVVGTLPDVVIVNFLTLEA